MSKSLNNAIFLSDDPDTIKKKVMAMYTDPNRKKATDPGETDPTKNPLWAFHETFNPDKQWVAETEAKYKAGQIGDVDCKRKLIEVLVAIIDPIRLRRVEFEKDPPPSSTSSKPAPPAPTPSPNKPSSPPNKP